MMFKNFEIYGWLMFFLCGLLFIIPAIANKDILNFLVGFTWIVGCLIFIFSLYHRKK